VTNSAVLLTHLSRDYEPSYSSFRPMYKLSPAFRVAVGLNLRHASLSIIRLFILFRLHLFLFRLSIHQQDHH
jgi:hypothetical protein